MLLRFRSMTACWARLTSKTLTWIRCPVRGKKVSASTETKKSVRSGWRSWNLSAPSIVS